MKERTLRGKTAIAGVGETTYYKHGQAPASEFQLALEAILKACADAGLRVRPGAPGDPSCLRQRRP